MRRMIVPVVVLSALSVVVFGPAERDRSEGVASPVVAPPRIAGYGRVVALPEAAEPPREGSKLVVDATAEGPRSAPSPALDKAARYVNLFADGGPRPAAAKITVVLHGEATYAALSDEAYARTGDSAANPNRDLLGRLREAGVELFVCGQALAAKGFGPGDVAPEVVVAVSAMNVLVNRQADGYAYVPVAR